MPRQKGSGKGETDRFNIRLDKDTGSFYRSKANEHGVSVSDYLRHVLVQGVIAETVQEIEERLRRTVAEINSSGANPGSTGSSDELLLSMFTSEAMLTAIVEARDVQALYAAQDQARLRLKKLKGG